MSADRDALNTLRYLALRRFTAACELTCRGVGIPVVSELDAVEYAGSGMSFRPKARALRSCRLWRELFNRFSMAQGGGTMRKTKAQLPSLANSLLDEIGEELRECRHVARGATCDVWKLVSDRHSYALKVFRDADRTPNLALDAFLRREVADRSGLVVVPILSAERLKGVADETIWILEPYIDGIHPPRGELTGATCKRLGETLAALHSIPTRSFGRPSELSSQRIVGSKANAFDGVSQRFENPLPETWDDSYTHPVLVELADQSDKILDLLGEVSDQVRQSEAVVCHSDLHERQLICSEGNLVALLDFGDAVIADRHWDLGSVRYFHGDGISSAVCRAYLSAGGSGVCSDRLFRAFSVAIAMHHASRSRLPGKTHRWARAVQFIRDTV